MSAWTDKKHEKAKLLCGRFQHICTCGGYARDLNGRPIEQPHMTWCQQFEEYAAWYASGARGGVESGLLADALNEIERLKESILDHDCPSFSTCPKHIGSRELEECPYCTIDRLTARWTKLRSGLAKFPAHSTKLAILLVDALEREEAK